MLLILTGLNLRHEYTRTLDVPQLKRLDSPINSSNQDALVGKAIKNQVLDRWWWTSTSSNSVLPSPAIEDARAMDAHGSTEEG